MKLAIQKNHLEAQSSTKVPLVLKAESIINPVITIIINNIIIKSIIINPIINPILKLPNEI